MSDNLARDFHLLAVRAHDAEQPIAKEIDELSFKSSLGYYSYGSNNLGSSVMSLLDNVQGTALWNPGSMGRFTNQAISNEGMKTQAVKNIIDILNFRHVKDDPAQKTLPRFSLTRDDGVFGFCSDAETGFLLGLGFAESSSRVYIDDSEQAIIYMDNGRPLIFQKNWGEATALTLEPLRTHRAFIPAGTIVAANRHRKWKGRTSEISVDTCKAIKSIYPKRPSDFTFSLPEQEVLVASDHAVTLDEIRARVAEIATSSSGTTSMTNT